MVDAPTAAEREREAEAAAAQPCKLRPAREEDLHSRLVDAESLQQNDSVHQQGSGGASRPSPVGCFTCSPNVSTLTFSAPIFCIFFKHRKGDRVTCTGAD